MAKDTDHKAVTGLLDGLVKIEKMIAFLDSVTVFDIPTVAESFRGARSNARELKRHLRAAYNRIEQEGSKGATVRGPLFPETDSPDPEESAENVGEFFDGAPAYVFHAVREGSGEADLRAILRVENGAVTGVRPLSSEATSWPDRGTYGELSYAEDREEIARYSEGYEPGNGTADLEAKSTKKRKR